MATVVANPAFKASQEQHTAVSVAEHEEQEQRQEQQPQRPPFIHDHVLNRQSTVDFIGSLLNGVDTPDEPLPQLFDGLPSSAAELAALSDSSRGSTPRALTPSLGCFLNNIVAEEMSKAAAAAAFSIVSPTSSHIGKNALKRFAPAPQTAALVKVPTASTPPHKRQRRIQSAPTADTCTRWGSAPSGGAGCKGDRPPVLPLDIKLSAKMVEPALKPKPKNPKRADRRRTIARFTTAILRAGGSNAFIARDGLGYRKAFDRFLVETYGDTFGEGGYWYENARVEPFFRVLFHVATDGRIKLDHDAVNNLFCKKEKRQAAEWLLDEEELSKFGVTATQLAQIFQGPPSLSPTGYPRGTPLAIPTDVELDNGAVPREGAAAAAAAAQAATQAVAVTAKAAHTHALARAAAVQHATATVVGVGVGMHNLSGAHGTAAGLGSAGGTGGAGGVGPGGPPLAHAHSLSNSAGSAQQLMIQGAHRGAHDPYSNASIPVATAVPAPAYHHPHQLHHAYSHSASTHIGGGGGGGGMAHHQGHQGYSSMLPSHVSAAFGNLSHAVAYPPTMLPPVSLPPGSVPVSRGMQQQQQQQHGGQQQQQHGGQQQQQHGGQQQQQHGGQQQQQHGGQQQQGAHLGLHAQQHMAQQQQQAAYGAAIAHQHQQLGGVGQGGGGQQAITAQLYDSRTLFDPVASGPRRQYSSDLSRLMSEFNSNPSSSDEFLKSFLQRTASELDNMSQMGAPVNK